MNPQYIHRFSEDDVSIVCDYIIKAFKNGHLTYGSLHLDINESRIEHRNLMIMVSLHLSTK